MGRKSYQSTLASPVSRRLSKALYWTDRMWDIAAFIASSIIFILIGSRAAGQSLISLRSLRRSKACALMTRRVIDSRIRKYDGTMAE